MTFEEDYKEDEKEEEKDIIEVPYVRCAGKTSKNKRCKNKVHY